MVILEDNSNTTILNEGALKLLKQEREELLRKEYSNINSEHKATQMFIAATCIGRSLNFFMDEEPPKIYVQKKTGYVAVDSNHIPISAMVEMEVPIESLTDIIVGKKITKTSNTDLQVSYLHKRGLLPQNLEPTIERKSFYTKTNYELNSKFLTELELRRKKKKKKKEVLIKYIRKGQLYGTTALNPTHSLGSIADRNLFKSKDAIDIIYLTSDEIMILPKREKKRGKILPPYNDWRDQSFSIMDKKVILEFGENYIPIQELPHILIIPEKRKKKIKLRGQLNEAYSMRNNMQEFSSRINQILDQNKKGIQKLLNFKITKETHDDFNDFKELVISNQEKF